MSAFGVEHLAKSYKKNEARLKQAGGRLASHQQVGSADWKQVHATSRYTQGRGGANVAAWKKLQGNKLADQGNVERGIRESLRSSSSSKQRAQHAMDMHSARSGQKGAKRGLYWTDMHTPKALKVGKLRRLV